MYRHILMTLLGIALVCSSFAQQAPPVQCGQKEITDKLLRENPVLKQYQEQVEQQLQRYNLARKAGLTQTQRTAAIVSLPVVVHIIHNNGAENITDAQVLTGIQHLNEAYANTGYYDPADGVNTQIQFCLAQRDPAGNATNGITRDVSAFTTMGGANYYSDDQAVKNTNRWTPSCYINIWLVRSIPGSVAGYAYLPSAHGSNLDGIVMEAAYFGSSYSNDVVVIHEMGHYLGLYHTFEGACKNDDCSMDGDRVCDTPPDQSTAGVACSTTMNSCSTDALSGFSTDENDLKEDYMDYGNFSCMKVFTQGQADRMNWYIQNVRSSLLACKSCLMPCPAPVTAGFTASATNINTGTNVTFTNSSVNAATYGWYLNNVLQSTGANHSYTFNAAGTYTIKLAAYSSNPLCDSAIKTEVITVTCPVTVQFSPGDTSIAVNNTLNFTNASTGATTYSWLVNGVAQSSTVNFSQLFATAGYYRVTLKVDNGNCGDSLTYTVVVRDTCLQQPTFQKTYGGQRNDFAHDIRPTPDGGYIVSGRTNSFGNGGDDGYILKIDKLGAVQWSQTYGGTANDVLYRIIPTSDGGYLAVGQTRSYGFPTGAAWIIKMDATGTVQWARQYGENTTNGELGGNAIEASDGSFVIVGRQDAAPSTGNVLVIKLSAAGTLIWSKIFDNGDSDNGSTLIEDNGAIIIAGTVRSTTYHDVLMMKLDLATGNDLWSRSIDADGRNNSGGLAIFKQGSNYLLHFTTLNDLTNTNTNRSMLLTTDDNGIATNVKEVIAPDYLLSGSGMFTITPDGGYVTQHNEDNTNSDFNLFKFNSAGAMVWSKKYIRIGTQTNYLLRSAPDGGFISAGINLAPGGNNDIYIAKTDIQGYTPGCDTTIVKATLNTPPFTTKSFNWYYKRNAAFIGTTNLTTQAQPANTQTNTLCSGTSCTVPPVPPIDSCNLATFVKHFDFPLTAIVEAPDENVYTIGNKPSDPANTKSNTGMLSRLDKQGLPVWNKFFNEINQGVNPVLFNDLCLTQDNRLAIIGNSADIPAQRSYFHFIKADTNGTLIYQKKWLMPNFKISVKAVIQASDKSYFSLVHIDRSPQKDWFVVIKSDDNGNILWSKNYESYLPQSSLIPLSIMESGNAIFISSAEYSGPLMSLLAKIDQATGNVLWSKLYQFNNTATYFEHLGQLNNTADIIVSGRTVTNGDSKPFLLRLDQTGNIIRLNEFNHPALGQEFTLQINKKDELLLGNAYAASGTGSTVTGSVLARTDANFNILWSRSYLNPANYPNGFYTVLNARNTGILAAGIFNYGVTGFPIGTLSRYTNDGLLPCLTERMDLQPAAITTYSTTIITETPNNIVLTPVNNTPQLTDVLPLVLYTGCTGLNQCDSIGIEETDTVCSLSDTIVIHTTKNNGCLSATEWSIDPAFAKVIAAGDSTISLQFLQKGTVTLYARITTTCKLVEDSLTIAIFNAPKSLNLGPDIQLCQVSTYALKAGSGFASYEWQDGSTDSTFTAYAPGQYHVLAKDHCGNAYRDTVNITQAPAIPFDLGVDLELCQHDTLTLTAPGGFTNYRWSANYKINSPYGQSIKIFTDKDTLYSVVAERSPGCLVIDTIHVKVKQATPVHLGNDTSFCINSSINLDAGPGFKNYTWSNGAITQQITAATAGTYWINAENNSGCISKDTLVIKNVYNLPLVNLGKDTPICRNTPFVFDAGKGFATYQWQDGSAGSTFTTAQTGMYWVKVTDSHTCTNADTAYITGIKALPADFLADTAQICEGQRIIIKSLTGFSKYQWYNNATASTIAVTMPGFYWLKATDANGCTGMDTIEVVDKECKKALYLPNAFTPNSNNHNEQFKPIVSGFLEKFRLTLYNRWGEKIFETTDATRGWDGTYKGRLQDTNSFVWICQYKFIGNKQVEKTDKGIVTLIR